MNKQPTISSLALMIATSLLLQGSLFAAVASSNTGCGIEKAQPQPAKKIVSAPQKKIVKQPQRSPATTTINPLTPYDEDQIAEDKQFDNLASEPTHNNSSVAKYVIDLKEIKSKKTEETKKEETQEQSVNVSLETCQNELSELNLLASQILHEEAQKNIASFEKISNDKTKPINISKETSSTNTEKTSAPENSSSTITKEEPKKEVLDNSTTKPIVSEKPSTQPTTTQNSNSAALQALTPSFDNTAVVAPLNKMMNDASFNNPELRKLEMEAQIQQASKTPNGLADLKQTLVNAHQNSSSGLAKFSSNEEFRKNLEQIMKKDPTTLSSNEKQLLNEFMKLRTQDTLAQEFITQLAVYEQKFGAVSNNAVNSASPIISAKNFRNTPMVQRMRDSRRR